MTLFLPLQASTPMPSSPSFLLESADSEAQLSRVIKSIMKAKRIVIICGAGISVQAGIPDFRSSEGLFKTLKRDNPREAMASGKDLFDASVFNSEHTTSLFCQMIAQLSGLSQAAEPTAFHHLLRALDDRGKLLRVYTQNIDAIEQKCGLSFGVPEFEDKRKGRPKGGATRVSSTELDGLDALAADKSPPSSSRLPCVPEEPPRCIPLHGTLQMLHCQICTHSFPLEDHLLSLTSGQPPQCPECTSMEETRQAIGKRARGIGRLRPSVVLYNEAHKDGEGVGEVVRKDLIGSSKGKGRSGADLLLVVGTSLRVPGTKRMVREFAKAVRSRKSTTTSNGGSGPSSPTPSPRRSPSNDDEPTMKAVYLNLDFPVPTREWEGVFDAWVQGDAQRFAEALREEIHKETRLKEVAAEKKRRRDEEMAQLAEKESAPTEWNEAEKTPKVKKRKTPGSTPHSAKRRKIALPPTPPKTPVVVGKLKGPHHDSGSTKLFLRIPARPLRTYLVPEVYITTPPVNKRSFGKGPPLITPEKTPIPRVRHNLQTKAGRKAARAARAVRPKGGTSVKKKEREVGGEDDCGSDLSDLLPDSFIRTVQYGLRG